MTSLYDNFFSETNTNHIYNILSNIIEDELLYDIKMDEINLRVFKNKMIRIFSDTDKLNLDEINKELLTEMINYFIQKKRDKEEILQQNKTNEPVNKEEEVDLMNEYNKYMSQRNSLEIVYKEEDNKKEDKDKDNKKEDKDKDKKEIKIKKKNKKNNIIISSKDRINKDSNRFNYKIKSPKEQLSELNSLIIPIEESIHFTNPILKIRIKELDLDLLLTCDKILQINNYKYGIYKPEKNVITKKSDILTINIESIYGNEEYNSDIIDITLDNNNNDIKLEYSEDFKTGDILILSNKDKIEFCKIKEKKEDTLSLEDIMNFEKGDELSILNSNLQNTLIFK